MSVSLNLSKPTIPMFDAYRAEQNGACAREVSDA